MTDMTENHELRVREGTAGAALAAARTAQNLTIADVARQLKLSASQVAALEAGEFDRLPGPVFVRGFVRNYARLLKLDPERLLDSMAPPPSGDELREALRSPREIPFPSKQERRWPRYGVMLLVALVLLAGYEFYWNAPPPDVPARAVVSSVVRVPAIPREEGAVNPAPAVASESEPLGAAQQQAGATTGEPAQEAREAAAGAPSPAASASELHFVFDKDSWIQVRERASGKVIFTRLNPAGTEQRVTGNPPFLLVIGNAGGVRLTYNDRPVDLAPHTVRDDVARLTLE